MGSLSTSLVAGTRLIDLVCWRTSSAGGIFGIMSPLSLIFIIYGSWRPELSIEE
jgi:hypothetical protein